MATKLAIPNVRLNASDEGETVQTKFNNAMQAVDDNVSAYNAQVDAADTAQSEVAKVLGITQVLNGNVMTKAEFDALAEKRIRDNNGSGYLETGKHHNAVSLLKVNEGIWIQPTISNIFNIGRSISAKAGTSVSDYPIKLVNGIEIHLSKVNEAGANENTILLPPVPDGLDKSDGTGRFATLAAAITAGTTALNASVITRQDLVLCKLIKGVDISIEDAWFPLGNRQFGATTFDGITLVNTNTTQAASAFGSWDTTTVGYSKKVSISPAADLTTAYQNHKNNLYSDNGVIKQHQHQIVVQQGLRDYANQVDAMAAFGYTQDITDKGLWTNGTDLFIPIALVQRRNKGAYHPVYNPEGCATWRNPTSGGVFHWHDNSRTDINSKSVALDTTKIGYAGGSTTLPATSWLGAIGGASYRSDGKFYDAVYAEDIQDLRNSARRKTPHELLEYAQKAIAGELRGFESVPFTRVIGSYALDTEVQIRLWNNELEIYLGSAAILDVPEYGNNPFTFGNLYTFGWYYLGVMYSQKVKFKSYGVGSGYKFIVQEQVTGSYISSSVYRNIGTTANCLVIGVDQTSKSESPTNTDLIGTPAAILATFPNGVSAQWIPDFTSGVYSLNRKSQDNYVQREYTLDLGITFVSAGFTIDSVLNKTPAIGTTSVQLVHYKTKANFLELANNSVVLEIGDVFSSQYVGKARGAELVYNTINKVATGTGYLNNTGFVHKKLTDWNVESFPNVNQGKFEYSKPAHDPITTFLSPKPTSKMAFYITQENSQYYLQMMYKEMIFDTVSSTWGDDSKFDIINGESTVTDNNAKTVLAGQKRIKLPFFTGKA
ncbi:MAG: hypothetical protein JKY55_14805 [Aliivibrio sp.]|uniref:hypothetical protein n=1 Tax=Aliivibrio sp. TaxID=1872443 RepID=UPI001A4F9717|nr:hypothetical protein [Aliivibrio sp.]